MENYDEMLEQIQHKINVLEGKKAALIQNFILENEATLFGEVLDLLTRTNIVVGDYYAPTRKYSTISGIKNLRVSCQDNEGNVVINIKVESKKGEYFAQYWKSQKPIVIKEYKVSFEYCMGKRYWK